jgi:hypothetical protein
MRLATLLGMKTLTALVLAALCMYSSPVFASDEKKEKENVVDVSLTVPPNPSRPQALPALYVGLAGLQAYDGYSTLRGVRGGVGTETNPLVGGLAAQPAAFWTLKAASTGLSIYLAEQYWRSGHRTKAIVTMAVANGLMAAVAARNARVLAR